MAGLPSGDGVGELLAGAVAFSPHWGGVPATPAKGPDVYLEASSGHDDLASVGCVDDGPAGALSEPGCSDRVPPLRKVEAYQGAVRDVGHRDTVDFQANPPFATVARRQRPAENGRLRVPAV